MIFFLYRLVDLVAAFYLHIHLGPVFSPIKENADDGLLLVPYGSFLLQLCLKEVLGPMLLHGINDLGGVLLVDDAMVQ